MFAQTDTVYLNAEDNLENLVQEVSEETDNNDLFDRFEYYLNNPVDINKAGITELLQLPLMDAYAANLIVQRRNQYGNYFSVQELYAIRELNKDIIRNIIPFITIEEKLAVTTPQIKSELIPVPSISKIKYSLRSRVITDLQTRRGFSEKRYAGSKIKSYNRLLIKQNNNYQIGLLTDKDPGETSYIDFVSFHLMGKELGIIKRIVMGDYLLEFGQGIALWSPYVIAKSSDAIYPVKKNERGLRAYTSSTEANFLRGGAMSIQLDKLLLTVFYSQNKFDASIDETSGTITSRPVDGFHRTESEIFRRNSAEEKVYGAVFDYSIFNNFKLGLLGYNSILSHPIQSSSTFGLSGDEFRFYSFYYDAVIMNMNVFGEFSFDQKSVASINGLQFSVTSNFSIVTAFRNYPSIYRNYRGSGFGERAGATSNETGFYTGFRWRVPVGVLNVYYDQFKFPFRTFNNVSPSDGDELLAELSSKPFSKTETKFRYKYENKDVTQTLDELRQVTKRLRQSFRIEITHSISNFLRTRSRVEYNYFNINLRNLKEDGYLFFQDIRFAPQNNIVVFGRIIFFKTDSFNSAIYEFENDLMGVMTNLAMYGEGMRWYLIGRYKVFKNLTLSFKYSETYKPKEKSLSSGNNLIPNNLDNRIGFQIDMNF